MIKSFVDKYFLYEIETIELKDDSPNDELIIQELIELLQKPFHGEYLIHIDTMKLLRISKNSCKIDINQIQLYRGVRGNMLIEFDENLKGRRQIKFSQMISPIRIYYNLLVLFILLIVINYSRMGLIISNAFAFITILSEIWRRRVLGFKEQYIIKFIKAKHEYLWYKHKAST